MTVLNEQMKDDYLIRKCGFIFKKYRVNDWPNKFNSLDDAVKAVRKHMDKTKHSPNVWLISDYGNIDLLTVNENGTYFILDSWPILSS